MDIAQLKHHYRNEIAEAIELNDVDFIPVDENHDGSDDEICIVVVPSGMEVPWHCDAHYDKVEGICLQGEGRVLKTIDGDIDMKPNMEYSFIGHNQHAMCDGDNMFIAIQRFNRRTK